MHIPRRSLHRGIKLRDSTSTGEPMIIDFDSHLREGYFMDEVYKLEGPYERFRPVKMNDGHTHNTKFLHSLDPISPQGHAAHRHPYIYDPKTNWRGGDVDARQVGGYDMARRREDIRKEGIDKQLIFPTQITVATSKISSLPFTSFATQSLKRRAHSRPSPPIFEVATVICVGNISCLSMPSLRMSSRRRAMS